MVTKTAIEAGVIEKADEPLEKGFVGLTGGGGGGGGLEPEEELLEPVEPVEPVVVLDPVVVFGGGGGGFPVVELVGHCCGEVLKSEHFPEVGP